jgi:hypothetical protein
LLWVIAMAGSLMVACPLAAVIWLFNASVMSAYGASVASAPNAGDAPAAAPDVFKLRLGLPIVSGASYVVRSGVPAWVDQGLPRPGQYNLVALSLSREWASRWIAEGDAGVVVADGEFPRGTFGLRGGRAVPIVDIRDGVGRGTVTTVQGLVGLAYRGQAYNWVHCRDFRGQRSLAATVTGAVDATYYTSHRFGWNARLHADTALVVVRTGPTAWGDGDEGTVADGYRFAVGGGLDLGVAF